MKKKSRFSKLHWTTKIIIVYLIKNSSLFYFLPIKWWSCDCYFFLASEAPKNFWGPQKRFKFWILDLKVCLKNLGIGSGLYGKSVLYIENMDKGLTVPKWVLIVWPKIPQMPHILPAQFACPSPKVWDFNEKKVSLGVRSQWTQYSIFSTLAQWNIHHFVSMYI